MVTNQNQLSNGLPVYTGNQSISASYNLLHRFTCGFFLKTKMDTSFSGFTAGPSSGSRQPHAGPRDWNPARVQFAAGLPKERSGVDFGTHSQSLPTNPGFFFSQTCWLRISLENGGRRRGKKRKGGGRKQPPGWRKILYVCALKHKVCGQLLKDFSGELRLSTESIE